MTTKITDWIFRVALLFGVFAAITNCTPAHAQSQRMYCDVWGDIAVAMIWDMDNAGYEPEHYVNANQEALARRALKCQAEGRDIKTCVIEHCMYDQT